ncbi:tyrosine-type recombinase/integrase [Celerinatantimonas diazotrophica]|uniref:tyrosine-type recombinase/integrase n=1 Tax=Celerinatantimonas diazotrophica TaxID=412034 RepID=UPI001CC5EA7D|nr:tyrosine-type recombinase/integrase [Celerinatantimonas diazotrophica]
MSSTPEAHNPAIAYLISLQSVRSRQTMKSFLNIVAKILGYISFKDCPWSELRRHHIQAVIEKLLAKGRSPATVNTYLAAIKGVMLEAWSMNQIDTDTYTHIRQIKSVKGYRVSRGRALSQFEIKQLFTTTNEDFSCKGVRDAAIIALLLGCGLRRAELVALNLNDIEYSSKTLVVMGKGNKQRRSFMPSSSWEYLQKWIYDIRGEYSGPLFTRIRRFDDVTLDRLSDQAIYHILQIRQKDAEIEPFAPHDLRRTFASMMLDNGEDIVTVKDAMGHASINTTQRYDRRGDERLQRASSRIIF